MRMRLIVLPGLALLAGLYIWKTTAPVQGVPAGTWRIGTGTEIRQGRNYDELAAETPVRLSFTGDEPRYVYVFSYSLEDGTLLLFPSTAIEADCSSPLPAGRTVLPGRFEGKELAWTTRSGIQAVTTYIALASNAKIDELEALLPTLRMWSNTVFPDHSMSVTQPGGEVELAGRPNTAIPSALLRTAADIGNAEPSPNGPMKPVAGRPGLFMSSWKIRERQQPPAKPAGEKK
jgi:hypothetical protein